MEHGHSDIVVAAPSTDPEGQGQGPPAPVFVSDDEGDDIVDSDGEVPSQLGSRLGPDDVPQAPDSSGAPPSFAPTPLRNVSDNGQFGLGGQGVQGTSRQNVRACHELNDKIDSENRPMNLSGATQGTLGGGAQGSVM